MTALEISALFLKPPPSFWVKVPLELELPFSILWPMNNSLSWFPGGSDGKASACNVGDLGLIPGSGRSPGEGRTLAQKIPWTKEPGRLQSLGLQRVRHDWAISLLLAKKWKNKQKNSLKLLPVLKVQLLLSWATFRLPDVSALYWLRN